MLLRLLFVLLIALNIAVAAWLLLGDTGVHAVDPTDSGVPKLKLLAELPAPTGSAVPPAGSVTTATPVPVLASPPSTSGTASLPTAPVPSHTTVSPASSSMASVAPPPARPATGATSGQPAVPSSPRRSYRCLAVGPFANPVDLRNARTALAARTVRSRQRQEQTSESRGWRVFLPALATREQALAQARRLEARGVKDYFVVTAQGELQNSIALGLFRDPANARKRRDEVVAAGFPARMSERTETTPVWWLDVVVPEEASADIRRNLRNPSLTARPTGCF